MPNIAIICSIERLFGPYGQLSKAAYFGMNLSAAIVGTQADVTAANKTFTVPWTWNLTGLKAWVGTSADPNQGQEVAVTLVPHDPIQRPDLITNALLNEPMQGPGAWLFHEAPESAASFDAKSWHSLLAHASTYPAPVPQSLNLALHFSIANLPAAGNLFVAPILDAGGAGNPITVIQAPSMPAAVQPTIPIVQAAAPGKIGFAKWNYVAPPAGQLPIAGYVNQIDLAEQPAKGDFIDFGNLWIKGVQQTEDWRAQLESRVAEAFDLSRAILDFAKSASLAPAAIADPFFASLHDRANAGLFFAPDGSSLARYLVDQCQAAIGDSSPSLPFVQALDTYEAALTLQDWEALLSQTIPEGPSIKIATIVALEAWWGLLADDGVLARLIYAQWQSAVKAAPQPVQDFWNKISGTLQNQVLPSIQLRKRYALATIGNLSNTAPDAAHGLWQLIATGANGIKANLTDYLVRYAKGRFGGGDASDQKRYEFFFPQKVAPIPADPTGFLTKFAGDFFQNVIQPPGSSDSQQPGQAAPMSTPAPTGITLQLDTITAVDDAADFQRKMTGAGVLMRKKGGTWRCLNVAAPYTRTVDSATGTATDAAMFPKGSVVPYRLDYHKGVRQAFVTYKNHPLVAESPAAPLAGDLQLKDDNSSAPSASLLVYKVDFTADAANPQVSNPWAILPGLFYSDDDRAYEFLPFAMTNSGAIPAELAVPESKGAQGNITPAIPSRIRDDPQTFSPANLAPIEAGYKRRVQVGALRFRDDKGQVLTEKSKLLPLPANAVPKFHDVAPQGETQPLLFLYQGGPAGGDSFIFSVRPPATDINTWDQWVGPGNREQRIRAWADYHANSPQAPVANPVVLDTGRVTFDDPAVTGLQATLSQIWPRNGTNISLPTVPFDKTGSLYQAPAIPVNCSIGAASIKPPSAAGGAIAVQVPANEVWQLSIVPLIAGAAKFEEGVLGIANDGPLAPAAFQAVIEVASPALPAAADIWGSLILPSDNTGASSFSVALKPNLSDPESPWANVRTVELLRQIWRWSGRPFSSFGNYPQNQLDPQPGGKETDAMLWEAEAFGDRDDSDHISISQQVNFASPAQGTEPPVLYTEDLSSDLRTHYYRFALRVTSRYSGILPAPQQTSQVPLVTSEGKGFTIRSEEHTSE